MWTAGAVFLAAWLPSNNGLRPEPLIAFGVIAVWMLVEWTIGTRRLWPVALAVVVAMFTVTLAPQGLIALAPLLVGARAVWRIVAARRPGSLGAEGIALFALPGDAAGLTRTPLTTLDLTRRLAQLDFSGVRVPASALLGGDDEAGPALDRALQLSAIGLAAEQVGGAQRCLDLSVAYANEREQFGRPIGSFQAIKHKCADMMVEVECARSAAYYAACVVAEERDELPECSALAAATCAEAYFRCAADAIQIHGGVGFTWEYDVQLHFKRAGAGERLLGEPAYHRERIAQEIGL